MPTLSPTETKDLVQKVNADLKPITDKFQTLIPLFNIAAVLTKHGLDPKAMENAFQQKDEGRMHVEVGQGIWLTMTWYKFETGRYEVVAYASSNHDDVKTPAKPMNSTEKRKAKDVVNGKLAQMGKTYYTGLGTACKEASDALEASGFSSEDFDAQTVHGTSRGNSQRIHADVGNGLWINFSWYKMDASGKFEITAYVS